MYNIETNVSESVGIVDPVVGPNTPYEWSNIGSVRPSNRTDNQSMQDFEIMTTNVGNDNVAYGLDCRSKTNSRMARTEIHVNGRFLTNTNGLQWYAMRCDFNTKERTTGSSYSGEHYNYHRGAQTNGAPWNDENAYKDRKDFNAGVRYYLIGIDPSVVYATDCYNQSGIRSWGFVTSISEERNHMNDNGAMIGIAKENHGRVAIYISKMDGLDFIRISQLWNDELTTEEISNWIQYKFARDIQDMALRQTEKKLVSVLAYDKPQVLYKRQFQNAKEIFHVGHLRFRRVADANLKKSGNTVIDLIEWYGIIPILNVPKTVSFACNSDYFVHHSNNARLINTPHIGVLGCTNCTLDNLELGSGRYVIDIDSECLYGKNDYRYRYTKKGWILSSLANMTVEIDNDTIDRIMPIDHEGLNVQGVVIEDDDFLNRF